MKKSLLMSAAAILIAGAGPGVAQGMKDGGMKDGAQAPGRAPAAQSAPAEKAAPPAAAGQGRSIPQGIPEGAKVPPGSSRAQDFKGAPETTGQGTTSQGEKAAPGANPPSANPQVRDVTPPSGRSQSTTGQGAASTSASLTGAQRTKISTSIKQQNVAPITNVSFSVAIGTAIPRDVRRMPLPVTVLEVYPAWRGYEFILVGGDILIIDPATLRIVAILEA